jgi:hypothetical protein
MALDQSSVFTNLIDSAASLSADSWFDESVLNQPLKLQPDVFRSLSATTTEYPTTFTNDISAISGMASEVYIEETSFSPLKPAAVEMNSLVLMPDPAIQRPDLSDNTLAMVSAPILLPSLFHQNSHGMMGVAEVNDLLGGKVLTDVDGDTIFDLPLGQLLAAGDFNGDGIDDFSIGVPYEDISTGVTNAGLVHVLHSTIAGPTTADDQLWHLDSDGVAGTAQTDDHFGTSLTAGDFNGDGVDDLVIGTPFADRLLSPTESLADAGSLNVLYGQTGLGLDTIGQQQITQDDLITSSALSTIISPLEDGSQAGDLFGAGLVAADFDNDGFDDLAVGAPGATAGDVAHGGGVNVLYGMSSGLSEEGSQYFSQATTTQFGQNLNGLEESGDAFGSVLAAGYFNDDAYADLVIGVPLEDVGGIIDAGAINVLYGSETGLVVRDDQNFTQESDFILGNAGTNDAFGSALAVSDFNGDGWDDVAVGAPGKHDAENVGTVNIIYGGVDGLHPGFNQLFNSWDKGGQPGDRFGASLGAGDFNNDGWADLAVGIPQADALVDTNGNGVEDTTYSATGAVAIYYGSPIGLISHTENNLMGGEIAMGSTYLTQADLHLNQEIQDYFGSGLTVGDYNGDGYDDLGITAPGESIGTVDNAGAAHIVYGSSMGLAW